MDFPEKLDYLMLKNNLNKSTLSKSCGIPYTTIDGWYKKGYEGLKISTLKKLSDFFGTSLDFWANDKTPVTSKIIVNSIDEYAHQGNITELEKSIIEAYWDLDDLTRKKVMDMLKKVFKNYLNKENKQEPKEDKPLILQAPACGSETGYYEIKLTDEIKKG